MPVAAGILIIDDQAPDIFLGVETREQLEFLRDHHCDEAQGYHISSPLPAMGISEVLRGGSILLAA